MQILENLELIDVIYENNNKLAILSFLDEEDGTIKEIKLNKQKHDYISDSYVDSVSKTSKINKICWRHFNTSFKKLEDCIGVTKNIYDYDGFNSLCELTMVEKFSSDMEGKIDEAEIEFVTEDKVGIKIYILYKEKTYVSKMVWSIYDVEQKKCFIDEDLVEEQIERFEQKFKVKLSQAYKLKGKKVEFEVKTHLGQHVYVALNELKDAN